MKRRLVCTSCGTSKNSATDRPLYALSDNHVMLTTMNTRTECWDCGEKRREAEELRRQKRQEAFLKRYKEENGD